MSDAGPAQWAWSVGMVSDAGLVWWAWCWAGEGVLMDGFKYRM